MNQGLDLSLAGANYIVAIVMFGILASLFYSYFAKERVIVQFAISMKTTTLMYGNNFRYFINEETSYFYVKM